MKDNIYEFSMSIPLNKQQAKQKYNNRNGLHFLNPSFYVIE